MRKSIAVLIIISLIILVFVLYLIYKESYKNTIKNEGVEEIMDKVNLIVNGKSYEVELENNSSSVAFLEKIKESDLTINTSDYGSFEKVGDLGFSLPTNDSYITAVPGDIILYQGDKITVYYGTNSYSFTRLGKIKNVSSEELKEVLGNGDVVITFSIKK